MNQAAATSMGNLFEQKLNEYKGVRGALIPMLQAAQDCFGYVPEEAIRRISAVTKVPVADIFGIVTFYAQFRLQPLGKYVIKVCEGTSCHVNGAKMIMQTMQDELSIDTDETDKDGLFTLLSVACIGCCSLAPVIMVNQGTHGRLTPASVRKVIRGYRREGKKGGKEGSEKAEENTE
jgi:NADH-quinone oxidoreductase subunit E